MTKFHLTVLIPTVLCAVQLNYRVAGTYLFDSNPAENSFEKARSYPIAELNGKVTVSDSVPVWIEGGFNSEGFVSYRDPIDCKPTFHTELGGKIGSKKLMWESSLGGNIYCSSNRYRSADSAEEIQSFILAERSIELKNSLIRKVKRYEYGVKTAGSLRQLGSIQTDSGSTANGKNGFSIEGSPFFVFDPKQKNRLAFAGVKSECSAVHLFARDKTESYGKYSAQVKPSVKLWYPTLSTEIGYSFKLYDAKTQHPFSGDSLRETVHTIIVEPAVLIPIFKKLSLETGAEFRFRQANFPDETYDRHIVYASLNWESSAGTK